MVIGIDISQIAYGNTGVSNYLLNLVQTLIRKDEVNEYVLFFSSLRSKLKTENLKLKNNTNFKIKEYKIPPTLLDLIWNRLHVLPIENFVGDVDVFITSDWTEPPARRAKKATILYDLLVYKYPKEMHPKIVSTQKRKIRWVKKESAKIFCISEATKKDAAQILNIDSKRLEVIYPGI